MAKSFGYDYCTLGAYVLMYLCRLPIVNRQRLYYQRAFKIYSKTVTTFKWTIPGLFLLYFWSFET